jgi:hypothetical protein
LFIVFRALGIISDKDICKMIVSDLEAYPNYVASLIPCVHDAGGIFNQMNALEYIASFTKVKTVEESYNILINYLLPHVGEMNFKAKAYFIGQIFFKNMATVTMQSFSTKSPSVQPWGTIWITNKIGPKVQNAITARPMKITHES